MLGSDARELGQVLIKLAEYESVVRQMANAIGDSFDAGGKLLTCGNGGSAAEASHFSEEMTGQYFRARRSLPGLCLAIDGPLLTCIGNDHGYDEIFSRQVEGLGNRGDVLTVLSSSGNSENIRKALVAAKAKGLITVSLLGKTGGICKGLADYELIVPSTNTARIQECHLMVIHTLCELIERRVLGIDEEGVIGQ